MGKPSKTFVGECQNRPASAGLDRGQREYSPAHRRREPTPGRKGWPCSVTTGSSRPLPAPGPGSAYITIPRTDETAKGTRGAGYRGGAGPRAGVRPETDPLFFP